MYHQSAVSWQRILTIQNDVVNPTNISIMELRSLDLRGGKSSFWKLFNKDYGDVSMKLYVRECSFCPLQLAMMLMITT